MFNYTPQNQLSIFSFKTDFESKLDPNNRWVKLAKIIDWDSLVAVYATKFSSTMGAPGIDARVVIGALIIKHMEAKDDRGTIEAIQENPYMQYFLGFDHFSFNPVFDPSLFVHIRKRLSLVDFDEMNAMLISKALNISEQEDKSDNQDGDGDSGNTEASARPNKGKLQMDATVADAHIKFPTDLSLLNDSREKSEEILDTLCKSLNIAKPRTYKRIARRQWLNISKSKRNSKKKIRTGIKQQLNYLKRNLKSIDKITNDHAQALEHLDKKAYRYLLIIRELYRQQLEMFQNETHSVANRIVSIHQPHIRPIVRGKAGKNVEFGAKINLSLQEGFARIDRLDFEAFNEGGELVMQVEKYKKLNGHYPELVQTDQLYLTRANRHYLKEHGINHTGKPLGRKPKEELGRLAKQKLHKQRGERNHIEGKFGQAKSKYKLNEIRAKLSITAQSWIGAIVFVLNILKLSKDYFCLIFSELFYLAIASFQIIFPRQKPRSFGY